MKRFLLLGVSFACISFIQAQSPLQKVLKSYFRTHPFDTYFSSFINSLQRDPWFAIEEYNRRTDTSFFYLTGTYKNFNPFRYQAKEVRLIIAESQFLHTDSLKTLDTIINIQLLGIAGPGLSDRAVVIKEFDRFQNKYAKDFSSYTYKKNESANVKTAELYNFYIFPYSISPITSAWGQLPDTDNYTFTITIRCKVKQNIADLIPPPVGL